MALANTVVLAFVLVFSVVPVRVATGLSAVAGSPPTTLNKKKVVVTGATGRTGRLVVQELLSHGPNVVVTALVRNATKARDVLAFDDDNNALTVRADVALTDRRAVAEACAGAAAIVWCSSGGGGESNAAQGIKGLVANIFPWTASSENDDAFDVRALQALGDVASEQPDACRVICLSSAAVTRPAWPEEKKRKYVGAADIPIVRLNPLGILDTKRAAEEALRRHAKNYVVVRPTGLNDDWPRDRRPVLSQGDVAVGRVNRADVAKVLAELALDLGGAGTAADRKTFEFFTLDGYPRPQTLVPQLSRLVADKDDDDDAKVDDENAALDATYAVLQQLVPGETLQPDQLAMGQTYEQLDKQETGRLGERGQERVPASLS